MLSKVFLAMTPGEMTHTLPTHLAYMACHFSPYSKGLSNLPTFLPKNSILLIDDSMSVSTHDPVLICKQLQEIVNQFAICAVLADFQNPVDEAALPIFATLLDTLSCPFAVTEHYAKQLHCPVFLASLPVNMALSTYLEPWKDQDIFLEVAPGSLEITLTEKGSVFKVPALQNTCALPLHDPRLHCHYQVEVFKDKAVFTLRRTRDDLTTLVNEAYHLGIHSAIGLYQELAHL